VAFKAPIDASAPWNTYTVHARLWYRIALQDIVDNIERQGLGRVDVILPPLLLQEASADTWGGNGS
jgi:hypothetical protein